MIKVGCCGFPKAKQKYYKTFNVVELQSLFYNPPDLKLAKKWREEAAKDFEFVLKAWQLITHEPTSPTYRKLKIKLKNKQNYGSFKPTKEVFEAWEKTKKIAQVLEAKIIVFQCPASFLPTSENKKNLINFFKKIGDKKFLYAWEPRGKWPAEEIKKLCKQLNLIDCVDPFKRKSSWGKINYFRLQGIEGYRYQYTKNDLTQLLFWAKEKKESYVMFNNVYMWEDALKFKKLL